MTFPVRLFGYKGLARIPVTQDGGTAGQDSVYVLEQGYLWNQTLTSNGTTSVASTIAAVPANHQSDPTRLLRVEVPDGSSIRYEISATGTAPTATSNSPLLTGRDNIQFGPGWIFAFIDAAST
jgi:hypothetical protein